MSGREWDVLSLLRQSADSRESVRKLRAFLYLPRLPDSDDIEAFQPTRGQLEDAVRTFNILQILDEKENPGMEQDAETRGILAFTVDTSDKTLQSDPGTLWFKEAVEKIEKRAQIAPLIQKIRVLEEDKANQTTDTQRKAKDYRDLDALYQQISLELQTSEAELRTATQQIVSFRRTAAAHIQQKAAWTATDTAQLAKITRLEAGKAGTEQELAAEKVITGKLTTNLSVSLQKNTDQKTENDAQGARIASLESNSNTLEAELQSEKAETAKLTTSLQIAADKAGKMEADRLALVSSEAIKNEKKKAAYATLLRDKKEAVLKLRSVEAESAQLQGKLKQALNKATSSSSALQLALDQQAETHTERDALATRLSRAEFNTARAKRTAKAAETTLTRVTQERDSHEDTLARKEREWSEKKANWNKELETVKRRSKESEESLKALKDKEISSLLRSVERKDAIIDDQYEYISKSEEDETTKIARIKD